MIEVGADRIAHEAPARYWANVPSLIASIWAKGGAWLNPI
jgi:hypothetical protein